jgi:hypothetical protein
MLQRQLSHLNNCKLDHYHVKASSIFCVSLRLVLCYEHVHSHDFVWPLLVSCIILLYNCIYIYMEYWKLCKSWTSVYLGKFPVVQRTLFCRHCSSKREMSAANFQAGQTYVITNLVSALWRVHSRLALKCLLLNRESILINVLKALASVIFMSCLQYNPVIEYYTKIFCVTDKGDVRCKMRKADGLSLVFIDFYVPVLIPCLKSSETSLQLSENITFFLVCHIYAGVVSKET